MKNNFSGFFVENIKINFEKFKRISIFFVKKLGNIENYPLPLH